MSPRFRKFLAASEIGGGLIVIGLPVLLSFQDYPVEWWHWILFESFGVLAVAAGRWLWRADPRGRELSTLIQAVQIIQFRTSTLGISAQAGFQFRLLMSEGNFNIGPGFQGTFFISMGEGMPWFISINFFSMYALYALLRSGPAEARDDAERDYPAQVAPSAAHDGMTDPLTGEGDPIPSSGGD